MFWHDPTGAIHGGQQFTSTAQARAHFAAHGLPRLSLFHATEAGDLCQLARETKHLTLVFDEVDRLSGGTKGWVNDAARLIVHEGRNDGIDLWGSARATRDINEGLIGQADVLYLFHHSEADCHALVSLRSRLGADLVDRLPTLRQWEFFVWTDDAWLNQVEHETARVTA